MKKEITKYKVAIFTLLMLCANWLFSTNNVDSLELVLEHQLGQDDQRAALLTYRALGDAYFHLDDHEKAIRSCKKALKISEALEDTEEIAKDLGIIGNILRNRSQYEEGFQYFFRLLELNKKINNKTGYANTLSRVAAIYQQIGDYEKAYDFQMKSLEIFEETNDTANAAVSLYRIGSIFYYQKNFELAEEHYKKSLKAAEQVNNERLIYSCYGGLGSVYGAINEDEAYFEYTERSLELAKKMNHKSGIAYALANMGSFYIKINDYKEAERYIQASFEMKKGLNDKWGVVGDLKMFSNLERDRKDYKKSLNYLEEALELAKELGSKSRIMELYNAMSEVEALSGNYDMAYKHLTKGVAMKDSILSESTLKEMKKRNSRYEIQKRESEITLLKKEKEIASLNTYIFIGAAVCLLLLSLLFFSRYRVQRKSNILLEEKNKEIFLQNEKLEEANERQMATNALLEEKSVQIHLQNKKLEESNEDLKNFAYVASHDLKEPLRMISSYTTLLKKRYSSLFDENATEFFEYVTDGVRRMEIMLDDLLSYSRVNSTEQPKKAINTLHILQIVEVNLRNKIETASGELRFNEEQFPIIQSNRTHMTQLFQNLVSNGFKFQGENKPIVTVSCHSTEKEYVFSVKDNGIGISAENKEKIFEMFRRLHTRDEYEGTGIGLATCKKIVERHNGQIWVESEPGQGCTFFFTIPHESASTPTPTNQSEPNVAAMS